MAARMARELSLARLADVQFTTCITTYDVHFYVFVFLVPFACDVPSTHTARLCYRVISSTFTVDPSIESLHKIIQT